MEINEYISRLEQLAGVVGTAEQHTIVPSGREMLVAIKARVRRGVGTNGNKIGSYSTKPMYAGPAQFIKRGAFKAQGKRGNIGDRLIPTARTRTNSVRANPLKYSTYTIAKPNYKPRKTMYLADGYKELRAIQGLEVGYMDLNYSGNMAKDYQMQQVAREVLLGMVGRVGQYQGLTTRFGAFYPPSASEKAVYFEAVALRTARLFRGVMIDGQLTGVIE